MPASSDVTIDIDELILDMTRACNSRCTYCSIWKVKQPPELSLAAIENVLSAPQLRNLRSCYVTGGEPYMSDRILDVATLLKRHCPDVCMGGATNAIKVDATLKRIDAILAMEIQLHVQVSLNGTRHDHDATRGQDGFWDRAVATIRALRERQIPVSAAFSIMPQTIASLPYIQSFCAAQEIGLEVSWVRVSSRYEEVDPSYAQWPKATKPHLRIIENLPEVFDCPGLTRRLVVTPKGDVYPCEVYSQALHLGNVEETPLVEILNAPRTRDVARMIGRRGCVDCQGSGETEGTPKWMIMDCYRRQSPQADRRSGMLRHKPQQLRARLLEVLGRSSALRPECADPADHDNLETLVRMNRARCRGRFA